MEHSKQVAGTIARLREDRAAAAARLDTIDLALANLERLYDHMPRQEGRAGKKPSTRRAAAAPRRAGAHNADSDHRRELLLEAIGKAAGGVTVPELRKQLPKMSGKDRSNTLHRLKIAGEIIRKGNAWLKAPTGNA